MTMTDEKYDRVEQAAREIVDAIDYPHGDPDDHVTFEELEPVVQNAVRVQLAEIYSRWEEQWALEMNDGKRRLGKQKL
jgi:hypothetical protein